MSAPASTSSGPDPWRGFRGVMAATLILEAIVVLLGIPVVAQVGGGVTAVSGGYLIGLAVVMVVLAGMQSRPWALWVNLGLQVVVVAGIFIHPALGFVGGLFGAVWLLIWYLRTEVLRKQRAGLLPGQQQP